MVKSRVRIVLSAKERRPLRTSFKPIMINLAEYTEQQKPSHKLVWKNHLSRGLEAARMRGAAPFRANR
jgi:hypothetical protein